MRASGDGRKARSVTIATAHAALPAAMLLALFAATLATVARAAPIVHTVTIEGFEFRPPTVTVKQGDIVVWQNKDILPHTATAQPAGFDTREIAPGASFRFTTKTKGRFDYICTLHPTMKGALTVE